MTTLDTQLDAVIAMLRAAGGHVGIEPGAPDYVKKAFLEMLLSCPDCPVPNTALAKRVHK